MSKKTKEPAKTKKNAKASVNSAKLITRNIPYIACYEESGMIQIEPNKYSVTYRIEAPDNIIDERYVSEVAYKCMHDIIVGLNGFEFSFTIRNSYMPMNEYLNSIMLIQDKEPAVNELIEDYNETLRENVGIGHNNFKMSLYLTLAKTAETPDEALKEFQNVDDIVVKNIHTLYNYSAKLLQLGDRLSVLYDAYHPEEDGHKFGDKVDYDGCGFSIKSMKKMHMNTKDVIAPVFYKVDERDYMRVGNKYVRMLFINVIPAQITDSLLSDLISISSNSILTVNYKPVDSQYGFNAAARLVKNNTEVKNVVVRDTITDRKNRRVDKKETFIKETEEEYFNKTALDIFTDATANEQPVFLTTFVIGLYSDTLDELNRDTDLLRLSANKYNCQVKVCDLHQNEAFQSVLPLGNMKIDAQRTFNVDRLSQMLPVNIQALFEKTVTLQGLNEINDNFVLVDRGNYPVGLIAGMKGSGKSFAMKREFINTLMSTNDTVVILNCNKYDKNGDKIHDSYEKIVAQLGGAFHKGINTDLFTCDDNYGLTTDNKTFKKMFLEAFVIFRLGIQNKIMTEKELDDVKVELSNEIEVLCECSEYTQAVSFAEAHPDNFRLFRAALRGFIPTAVYPDFTQNRINLVSYDTASELLMQMDYLWNFALAMKKANRNVWIYIDGIDDFMYSTQTSDYIISLADKCEKIKVPITMVAQDSARISSNDAASIEFDYFLGKVDYFKLLSQGVIERKKYAYKLDIPASLIPYITDREPGEGIIITPSANISFNDRFETDSNPFYAKLK